MNIKRIWEGQQLRKSLYITSYRKAIQIGLGGDLIKSSAKDDILEIGDISDFVTEQFEFVKTNELGKLMIPAEEQLLFNTPELNQYLIL